MEGPTNARPRTNPVTDPQAHVTRPKQYPPAGSKRLPGTGSRGQEMFRNDSGRYL